MSTVAAPYALGILGSGNMAEAITRGLLSAKYLRPDQIIAADIVPERRALFEAQFGVTTTADSAEAAKNADLLLLSVKPQQMADALAALAPVLRPNTLLISIAAAISTQFIEHHAGGVSAVRVVRAMPNTPMLLGAGIVAICPGKHAATADMERARAMFATGADVLEVDEAKMDAVTAVSGSGPAYVFYLAEQMIRAGVELGLTPAQAHQLATQTALGAAKMLTETKEAPSELRRKVTSPGGTTQAAIAAMDARGWAQATVDAVKAAAQRGKELSR